MKTEMGETVRLKAELDEGNICWMGQVSSCEEETEGRRSVMWGVLLGSLYLRNTDRLIPFTTVCCLLCRYEIWMELYSVVLVVVAVVVVKHLVVVGNS